MEQIQLTKMYPVLGGSVTKMGVVPIVIGKILFVFPIDTLEVLKY